MNWIKVQNRFDSQSEEIKRLKPTLFDVMTSNEREQLYNENQNIKPLNKIREEAKYRIKEKVRLRNERISM